jgi:hypothetical protein
MTNDGYNKCQRVQQTLHTINDAASKLAATGRRQPLQLPPTGRQGSRRNMFRASFFFLLLTNNLLQTTCTEREHRQTTTTAPPLAVMFA